MRDPLLAVAEGVPLAVKVLYFFSRYLPRSLAFSVLNPLSGMRVTTRSYLFASRQKFHQGSAKSVLKEEDRYRRRTAGRKHGSFLRTEDANIGMKHFGDLTEEEGVEVSVNSSATFTLPKNTAALRATTTSLTLNHSNHINCNIINGVSVVLNKNLTLRKVLVALVPRLSLSSAAAPEMCSGSHQPQQVTANRPKRRIAFALTLRPSAEPQSRFITADGNILRSGVALAALFKRYSTLHKESAVVASSYV